jgi:3-oxosteroid 1-dehydrogenase
MSRSVAVIGSGAAGLAAALAAATGGARVTVYEKAEGIGGTTALSGGNAWLPAHDGLADDSPEEARAYLRSLALGDADHELIDVFAHEAGPTARRLQRETPLELQAIPYCDYHAEFDGGRPQGGRTLEPRPLDPAPDVAAMIRSAPNITGPVTYTELATGDIDREALDARRRRGTITLGRALIAGLVTACLDAGVVIRTRVHITERPEGADAVVLASGGFERDPQLVKTFLRGPMLAPVGVPGLTGDGLRMARAQGAALGTMSEAWWCPAIQIPGEQIDGVPMSRLILTERTRPGSIIVNSRGMRFVNEAQNYNDLGRALQDFDPGRYTFRNVPAYLVFDASYRRRYRLGPLAARDPDPSWLAKGETITQLAEAIGVPPATLEKTVARFNDHAVAGEDPDFGRGSYAYDRFIGSIGPLDEGPYYAVRVLPGCLGTKGGPRIDAHGRVLARVDGQAIPGLYAAGNVSASFFGLAYPGAGGTLGPALVFGFRAGDAAVADA